MPAEVTDPLFLAISFAARAHRHQLRKDRDTPYIAHAVRVAFVVRQVFGVADPRVLAAAVLHDTIEDTPTDYDDLAHRFGEDVAGWVSMLTKEMRLPEEERETAYKRVLSTAPWQVVLCKLADIYDNLGDCITLPPAAKARTLAKATEYLDSLRPTLRNATRTAFEVVERRLDELKADSAD